MFKAYVYICSDCGKEYVRRHKVDTKNTVCGRCYGTLKLKKTETL